MRASRLLVGIDVGGTFTDAIVLDAAAGTVLQAFKLPSTPADPAAAVLRVLQRIAETQTLTGALVCHGTTVGTNTLIERDGAKVGLLATAGFVDVIELRRQNRPTLYDLAVQVSEPLVPRDWRFGVAERMDAAGSVVEPLSGLDDLCDQVRAAGVTSVAIALLHSYANPTHEQQVRDRLAEAFPDLFLTASSDVCPEFREFERTSTAVVNAYIGPAVGGYIHRVSRAARDMGVADLMIVKSNGGLTSPDNAARYPVHLIESGPAAAMIATAAYARATRRADVIAFDMGGTTAKVGVVQDYQPKVTDEFHADALHNGRNVGGYPIRSAVLDIIEIGAGGGSIAWIDGGGVPKVGPESAGADPGPACYSRGGDRPTVTDAHAVIGTLDGETFAGTGIQFSRERALAAIDRYIAGPMGWPIARAAHAIIDIAVANMTEMVRLATVRRGLDPRSFSILASGGAGPLHAAAVGREIGVKEVVIPPYPGMFSALGAVLGDIRHDLSQTLLQQTRELKPGLLADAFGQLEQRARGLLAKEPKSRMAAVYERYADLRFAGQLFELRVELGAAGTRLADPSELEGLFRQKYAGEFGFELPDATVQLVKLSLVATQSMGAATEAIFADRSRGAQADGPKALVAPGHASGSAVALAASAAPASAGHAQPCRMQPYLYADGTQEPLPVYRSMDCIGLQRAGPMLIEHAGSTVWVPRGLSAAVGADGCVVINEGVA